MEVWEARPHALNVPHPESSGFVKGKHFEAKPKGDPDACLQCARPDPLNVLKPGVAATFCRNPFSMERLNEFAVFVEPCRREFSRGCIYAQNHMGDFSVFAFSGQI